MTLQEVVIAVSNDEVDVLQVLLDVLEETGARYCASGGLAVDVYAQSAVRLDLDLVVEADRLSELSRAAVGCGATAERSLHGVRLSWPGSDLRVRLQSEPRYQEFLSRAEERTVLGHPLRVAAVEDVLRAKLWAYRDERRSPSQRVEDLADVARMVEARPELAERLPERVRERLAGGAGS